MSSNTPDWANLTADDLLSEWAQRDETGWKRGLAPIEAHVLLAALYDAKLELAEHPRRCDEPSPDGSLMCDEFPGHQGPHVSLDGTQWSESRGRIDGDRQGVPAPPDASGERRPI